MFHRDNFSHTRSAILSVLLYLTALLGVSVWCAEASSAEIDWPQFLGPQRNGISLEKDLMSTFPAAGPKVLWKVPGGVGMSGLAVSRGRVLTLVQAEGQQFLQALSFETGVPVWRTAIAPEYRNSMGDGPRATPTIAGDQVFAFSGQGILAAVSFQDGRILWTKDTLKHLSGKEAEYGMASSPLVVRNTVIVTVGAPQATLVAYDIQSGVKRWAAGEDPAGYSSPALLDVGGQPQIVSFTGNSAVGVAPDTGTLLWRFPYETNYECNIATPLEVKGNVFLSAGENHGSVLLSLMPQSNRVELKPVWESFGSSSVMRNEWQTSILLDGYLYGFDNVGGAGPITHLTCINAATGQRVWQQPRFGKGNMIAADGKLFISTMKGELVIVKATPERFEELARATVIGSTRQAPSLAQGRLLLRDNADVVCVDVRKP